VSILSKVHLCASLYLSPGSETDLSQRPHLNALADIRFIMPWSLFFFPQKSFVLDAEKRRGPGVFTRKLAAGRSPSSPSRARRALNRDRMEKAEQEMFAKLRP